MLTAAHCGLEIIIMSERDDIFANLVFFDESIGIWMSNLHCDTIDKYLFSKKLRSKEFVLFEIPNSLGIPSYFWKRDWKGREFSRDDIFDDENSYSRDFSQRIRPPFLWSWDIYIYIHVIYTGIRINVYEERAQSFVWKNVRHQAVCKNPFKRNEEKGGEKSIGETVGNSKYALLARPCETI